MNFGRKAIIAVLLFDSIGVEAQELTMDAVKKEIRKKIKFKKFDDNILDLQKDSIGHAGDITELQNEIAILKDMVESLSSCCPMSPFPSWSAPTIKPTGSGDGGVLCPGMREDDFCDCDRDCDEFSPFCECAEAQKCCGRFSPTTKPTGEGDGGVLCPGMQKENYCDCNWDCGDTSPFCDCAEAQKCCGFSPFPSSSPNIKPSGSGDGGVVCPGMKEDDFCDCDGDCENRFNKFCECPEAQKCCSN